MSSSVHVASYLSAIPVAVVTVYGAILLVWRSGMRWTLGSLFMYVGLAGWILGGVGALLDATVQFNTLLHNTLWVPGHFHSYLLGGSLYFALGWVFQTLEERTGLRTTSSVRWLVAVSVFGGTTLFVASFYVAGAAGVPRRFALAQDPSAALAGLGSLGAMLLIAGLGVCLVEDVRLWRNGRRTAVQVGPAAAPALGGATPFSEAQGD